MSDAWPMCLDTLQDHLDAQRRAVDEGRFEQVTAFSPPAGLGALPPALARRAGALAVELERLAADLEAMSAAHARQLQVVAVLTQPARERPAFLDERG